MQLKSVFLIAALLASPAATAFAQASASQPAPSSSGDSMAQPGPAATPTTAATSAAAVVPATAADLTPKAIVYDSTGAQVGTIESVTGTGAVVFTGVARAQIPVGSFSKNAQGLVIGMTRSQLEAAVAQASAKK